MKTPDKPWGRIEYIFQEPLREERISTTFETSRQVIVQTKELIKTLQQAIDRQVERLGFKGKSLMALKPLVRDGQLGKAIKYDTQWQEAYAQLVSLHAPGMDIQESTENLTRADWNSLQFGLIGLSYEAGILRVNAGYSHSYFDTLSGMRNQDGKRKFSQLKTFDPSSVAGFTITSDNYLVLGLKGGTNFRGTFHYLPVGSVEPLTEKNPFYESLDKENKEEINLERKDWYNHSESGLAAIVKDIPSNRSYAIFEQHLNYSVNDLILLWESSAMDREEHLLLVPFPNDSTAILEEIYRRTFNFEKVIPISAEFPLSRTSGINNTAILPQCAIGLLAAYARKYGYNWAKNAEKIYNGLYDLTSVFRRTN